MADVTSNAYKWQVTGQSDESLSEFVTRVLKLTEVSCPSERRWDRRTAYPHLLTLTPLDDRLLEVAGEPLTIVGKHFGGARPGLLPRASVALQASDRVV